MEDHLVWRTNLIRRRPWGIQPWMEDNFEWKMTLNERRPWMGDNHGWKMTLDGRRPGMEFTVGGRQPWMEDNLWVDDNICMEDKLDNLRTSNKPKGSWALLRVYLIFIPLSNMSLYIILLPLYTVAGGEESIVLVILLHEEHLGEENHEGRNTGAT